MESWFSFARREAAAGSLLKEECLALIRKATGRKGFSALRLRFSRALSPCSFPGDVRRAAEENRELQILTKAAETKREIARRVPGAQYDAYLRAGYGFSSRFPGRNGTEAFLSMAFDVPFGKAGRHPPQGGPPWPGTAGHEMEARRIAIVADIRGEIARFDSAAQPDLCHAANARTAAGVRPG